MFDRYVFGGIHISKPQEVFGDVYGTLFSAVLGDGVWVKPFDRPYLLYIAYIHR